MNQSTKVLLVILGLVVVLAGTLKLLNPHKKYSRAQFWETATVASVAEVPEEALEPGNRNGPVLMWAAMAASDPDILEALVARGADVNESDGILKGTPLSAAAAYTQNPDIIDKLVALGADIDKQVHSRETAIMLAARYNKNAPVAERLIFHGADLLHTNSRGDSAQDIARRNNNPTVYKVLRSAIRQQGQD